MIEIKQISKTYKKFGFFNINKKAVLNNVTFTVNSGDCVGVIGGSGNGKSTLSKIILNLEKYDSGSILIDGIPHKKWLINNTGKYGIVFQDYQTSVNPKWNIKKIMEEALHLCKIPKYDYQHRILDILEKVSLPKDILDKYPYELSGGQLQRVCIARALLTYPKFLILDEAISSLDVIAQYQIIELLNQLQDLFKLTYIFISHDLKAVYSMCNRIVFLHEGVIIEETTCCSINDVKSNYARSLLQLDINLNCKCNLKEEGY